MFLQEFYKIYRGKKSCWSVVLYKLFIEYVIKEATELANWNDRNPVNNTGP